MKRPGIRRFLLAASAVATLAACAATARGATGTRQTGTMRMMQLPPRYAQRCRSSRLLRPACPRLIPRVPDRLGGGIVHGLVASGPIHVPANGFAVFDLQHGVPHELRTRLNRPPAVLHLTVVAGPRPGNLFAAMPYPGSKANAKLRDGLDRGTRRRPLLFGSRVWGHHRGALFLAPSYPFGGQIGGHLTFWWRSGGNGYVVSLHAWEPLRECARVLRAIVASTG